MSIHLMSLVWEIPFPTQTQKLTLLKLADHATDDGASVFPANETLAYQVGCDPRTIQRSIKALEQAEILKLLRRGGTGPKDTNQWQINVERIAQLAVRDLVLISENGCLQAVENKGDSLPPSTLRRVTNSILRVTPVSSKGDTGVTQISNNHHLESSGACADARDGSRTAPAGKPITSLTVERGDASWSAWMERLKPEQIRAAEQRGRIEVSKRWPVDDAVLHTKLKHDHTDRMLGEGDAA